MVEGETMSMDVELEEARERLSDLVDRVEHQHTRVTVIRDGRPVVVLINPDDLAELEETLDVLLDPRALADLSEGDHAHLAGKALPDNVESKVDPTSRGDQASPS